MGWLENQYRNTGSVGSDGKFTGRGIPGFFWQQFVDEDKVNAEEQRAINANTALQENVDISTLKGINPETASTYEVRGAIIGQKEAKRKQAQQDLLTEKLKLITEEQKPTIAGIEASLKKSDQQTQLLLQQGRDAHALRLQELAASRENQANQLEYQKMRDRRADQEYNERMERLDRKDRQAMLQNLAAGLASLGAAFAL